jgi:hypothetical protein
MIPLFIINVRREIYVGCCYKDKKITTSSTITTSANSTLLHFFMKSWWAVVNTEAHGLPTL